MGNKPPVTPQPAFAIRKATGADAAGILDCLRLAFEPYRGDYTAEGFNDSVLTAETIHQRMATMSILVAIDNGGQIAGTIASRVVCPEEGHLRGMAVLPEWQGSGLGQQLLAAAESELRARQCRRVTLNTTQPLQRAIRFYEKNGYRLSGKVTDFFGMPLYEYVKPLPPV